MDKEIKQPLWEQYKDALNFCEMFKIISDNYKIKAEHLKERMDNERNTPLV